MENTDHDLLIRLDEKVDAVGRDIKHLNEGLTKKADISLVNDIKEDVRVIIATSIRPIQDEVQRHSERLTDHETRLMTVEKKIDRATYIMVGGSAVIGFIWTIIWFLIQKYWS